MKEHTARRAQNATKRWNLKDYDHDWNKIKGWIREYMERNRESRADVLVDSDNRSVVRAHICTFVRIKVHTLLWPIYVGP